MVWHSLLRQSHRILVARTVALTATAQRLQPAWPCILGTRCTRHGIHSTRLCSRDGQDEYCASSRPVAAAARAGEELESSSLEYPQGRIDIIIGPMFSGKTSTLVERIDVLQQRTNKSPPNVLIVKSDKDVRYSAHHIVTHTGIHKPCHAVSSLHDVYSTIKEEYDASAIIAIDEAQFFGSELVDFCTRAADEHHKHVIVAGLDGDFMRNKFGFILDMIPVADSVVKLTASCRYCDDQAVFSLRLTESMEQEQIGGSERYVAVCRKHYVTRSDQS